VGKSLGKVASFLSFVEVVCSPATVLDGGPLVQTATMVWCEVEKIIPLGRELETILQAVDCFTMERFSFGPSGKDLQADVSRIRDSRGCNLACSKKKRVAVDDVSLKLAHQCRSLGFSGSFLIFLKRG